MFTLYIALTFNQTLAPLQFLCNGLEEHLALKRYEHSKQGLSQKEALARASGKMVLLAKLLPKLRAQGKRVLIFSQVRAKGCSSSARLGLGPLIFTQVRARGAHCQAGEG